MVSVVLLATGGVCFISCLSALMTGKSYLLDYWFAELGPCSMSFTFYLDWMSLAFMTVICWISGSIVFYSSDYMEGDRNTGVFLVLLVLFIGSMGMVVFSLNMVSIMLGWDGLGLVSFLLVIFYQNSSSASAATITALSNRVGDGMILILIGMGLECGVWGFGGLVSLLSNESGLMFAILLLAAAITKSAQIPFSAWLPRAMAAPTPVSSLVHSSTLVTAGVYLLLRMSVFLSTGVVSQILLLLGVSTMILASMGANFEQDFKKIVALSTLSQLGLMVTSLGLGLVLITFFHLVMHAIFKALLFMCSGEVIHYSAGTQDLRYLGGILHGLPFTGALMNLCNLALCGFPFLSGFFSKDAIMEMGYSETYSLYFMMIMALSVGLSGSYSIRLSVSGFVSNSNQLSLAGATDPAGYMFSSKFLLGVLAVVAGAASLPLIAKDPLLLSLTVAEKCITLVSTLIGFVGGVLLSCLHMDYSAVSKGSGVTSFLSSLWFLSPLSGSGSVWGFSEVSKVSKLEESSCVYYFSHRIKFFVGSLSLVLFGAQKSGYNSYLGAFGLLSLVLLVCL